MRVLRSRDGYFSSLQRNLKSLADGFQVEGVGGGDKQTKTIEILQKIGKRVKFVKTKQRNEEDNQNILRTKTIFRAFHSSLCAFCAFFSVFVFVPVPVEPSHPSSCAEQPGAASPELERVRGGNSGGGGGHLERLSEREGVGWGEVI